MAAGSAAGLVLELIGVVLVSAAELVVGGFGRSTVWSGLGIGYGFAPLILPVLGPWLLGRDPGTPGRSSAGSGRRRPGHALTTGHKPGTIDPMAALDADLVRRWFDRLLRQDESVVAYWGVRPTVQEIAALDEGSAGIDCALRDLPRSAPVIRLTETPARLIRDYLAGFAAGISETRRLLADEPPVGLTGVLDPGAEAEGALALAAALNAGAAALDDAVLGARLSAGSAASAAESARSAGVAAAELVVDGADLHRVAASAAGQAVNAWRSGVPTDPGQHVDYRTKALVGMLLVALELECRDPLPPARPAACGARPGENRGAAFLAEITCTMHADAETMATLTGELNRLCRDVAIWPTDRSPEFHLHTDRPGEVIEQLYASGMPFDLQITRLD